MSPRRRCCRAALKDWSQRSGGELEGAGVPEPRARRTTMRAGAGAVAVAVAAVAGAGADRNPVAVDVAAAVAAAAAVAGVGATGPACVGQAVPWTKCVEGAVGARQRRRTKRRKPAVQRQRRRRWSTRRNGGSMRCLQAMERQRRGFEPGTGNRNEIGTGTGTGPARKPPWQRPKGTQAQSQQDPSGEGRRSAFVASGCCASGWRGVRRRASFLWRRGGEGFERLKGENKSVPSKATRPPRRKHG